MSVLILYLCSDAKAPLRLQESSRQIFCLR